MGIEFVRYGWCGVVLCLLLTIVLPDGAIADPCKVYALATRPLGWQADETLKATYGSEFGAAFEKASGWCLLNPADGDVQALFKDSAGLLECSQEDCAGEVFRTFGIDMVVGTRVTRAGDLLILDLVVLDGHDEKLVSRVNLEAEVKQLADVKRIASKLAELLWVRVRDYSRPEYWKISPFQQARRLAIDFAQGRIPLTDGGVSKQVFEAEIPASSFFLGRFDKLDEKLILKSHFRLVGNPYCVPPDNSVLSVMKVKGEKPAIKLPRTEYLQFRKLHTEGRLTLTVKYRVAAARMHAISFFETDACATFKGKYKEGEMAPEIVVTIVEAYVSGKGRKWQFWKYDK